MLENCKELLDEIETDKQIDPDALDVDWIDQTNLYYKYSSALNDAISERNNLKLQVERVKENFERIKAQLDLEIREDPDSFSIPKITEATVSSAILLDDRYHKAFEEYMNAKNDQNIAQDVVNRLYSCTATMEEKKSALEQLVRLLNQQYFSTPSEPRDLSQEYHKKVNENKNKAKEKIRKRRKQN